MSQQCMFTRSEMDGLARTRRGLEWEALPYEHKRLVGRCKGLGEAAERGALLSDGARREVAAAAAIGLLGWLREPLQAALTEHSLGRPPPGSLPRLLPRASGRMLARQTQLIQHPLASGSEASPLARWLGCAARWRPSDCQDRLHP